MSKIIAATLLAALLTGSLLAAVVLHEAQAQQMIH